MGRFVNLHEDILRQIFGLSRVAERAINGIGDRSFVFFHQFLESVPIPSLDAKHERGIGIEIVGHGCSC